MPKTKTSKIQRLIMGGCLTLLLSSWSLCQEPRGGLVLSHPNENPDLEEGCRIKHGARQKQLEPINVFLCQKKKKELFKNPQFYQWAVEYLCSCGDRRKRLVSQDTWQRIQRKDRYIIVEYPLGAHFTHSIFGGLTFDTMLIPLSGPGKGQVFLRAGQTFFSAFSNGDPRILSQLSRMASKKI